VLRCEGSALVLHYPAGMSGPRCIPRIGDLNGAGTNVRDRKTTVKTTLIVAMIGALALVLSVSVPVRAASKQPLSAGSPPSKADADVIPRQWLTHKTTIDEAEQKHLVRNEKLGPKPVPFGFINDRWIKFKSRLMQVTNSGSSRVPRNLGRISLDGRDTVSSEKAGSLRT
jgi:hypothetical protein